MTALTFAAICRDDLEEPTADGRTERWGIANEELIPLTIHMTQKAFEKIGNIESAMDGVKQRNYKNSIFAGSDRTVIQLRWRIENADIRKGIKLC